MRQAEIKLALSFLRRILRFLSLTLSLAELQVSVVRSQKFATLSGILNLKIKFVVEEVGTRNRRRAWWWHHRGGSSAGPDKCDIICLP